MRISPGNPLRLRLLPFCAALAALSVPTALQAARTAYYQFESSADPGLDSAGGDDSAVKDGGDLISTGAVVGAGALLLDGKTPGFTIPAGQNAVDADFTATENFTVSAWFRVTAAKGRQRIFATYPGWAFGLDFTLAGTSRVIMTAYGVEDKFFEIPELVTGKWYHLSAVVKPADVDGTIYTRIFLNGEPLGFDDDGHYNSAPNNLLLGSAGGGFEGFNGALDEVSYFDNALSDAEALALYRAGAVDSDGDGMLNTWESSYGLNPDSPADANSDFDNDGLSNKLEYDRGLLPNSADTDGDGYKDGVEDGSGEYIDATHTGTDPKNPDSDGDGIPDGAEMAVTPTDPYATNPTKTDTDDDRLPDNYEVFVSKSDPTNPGDPAPVPNLIAEYRFELPEYPGLDSSGGDDNATVTGGAQVSTGALSGTGAYSLNGTTSGLTIGSGSQDVDPDFASSESFSISTWIKVGAATGRQRILCCSAWGLGVDFTGPVPRVLMTTFGVEDKFFAVPDLIAGKWFHLTAIVTPPDAQDVVFTKIYLNGVFVGQDDGPVNPATQLAIGSGGPGSAGEAFNGMLDELRFYDTVISDAKILELYAVGNSDEDHDGIPANWELTYGLNPNNPADAAMDLDGDGLSNLAEYTAGLLPNDRDTDKDGLEDGVEDKGGVYISGTQTGTDPQKPDTDGDGINDGAEKAVTATDPYSTDPTKSDTDGDSYPDGYEVTVLFTDPTNPADPNRAPGLIAHYAFDDANDFGIDSAGGDDNATPTAGVYQLTGGEAKIGEGAVYLSGTDFLRVGAGSLFADTDFRAVSGFSAASWFNLAEATGRRRLFSGWPGWGLGFNFNEGEPNGILLTAFAVKDAFFPVTVTAGEWHHLAFSVSSVQPGATPSVLIYFDGVQVGQDAFTFNPGANYSIGSFNTDGAFEAFMGGVDDLRYYNKEITAQEVAALYAMAGGGGDDDFRISSVALNAGRITLTFPSEANVPYVIQRNSSLEGVWSNAGEVTATGPVTTWTEPAAPPAPATRYFYRVVRSE